MQLQLEGAREATRMVIEQSCLDFDVKLKQMRIEAMELVDLMEDQAKEREKQRNKKFDDKLASIPSESTVNEWACTATHDYLNDPSTFDTITTACDTANSSIAASYKTGTISIRNETAKAIKGVTDAQRKVMKDIECGREKAITIVASKIDNMGAYQKIADARQQALKEIADAARTVMVDIQAAAPFPGAALSLLAANILGMLGQANSSGATSHG